MSDNHVFKPYIGISGGLAISDNPFGWRPETGGRAALSLGAHIRFNPNDRFRAKDSTSVGSQRELQI